MDELVTYATVEKYDPTRTTALRNAFARDMRKRFTELAITVKQSIYNNDCFGLKPKVNILQMTPALPGAFAFPRSAEKIEAFMQWLQKQVDAGIIQVGTANQIGSAVENAWLNMYILDSYKRGIMRAREEMRKAGIDVPTIEMSGGLNIIMGMPFHIDRVGLLFTRTFAELKGITTAMDSQISQILAQGMIDGDGPALLARKLVATINGYGADTLAITDTLGRFIPAMRRAIILARTEIIRAHHVAMIQEYRNWGLAGVIVLGEWKTAGDDRVCDKCAPMEGKIFTLDEIEGLIPYHPQCRCIALPWIEELQKYYNK
jgi:SPP1 gp7 family putative phage head morphogenesis protein